MGKSGWLILGRINFGPELKDFKGILSKVYLDTFEITGNWVHYVLDLNKIKYAELKAYSGDKRSGFVHYIELNLEKNQDTYIDVSQFNKGKVKCLISGVLWVNGRNLGRYWNIGPQ